MTWDQVHIFFDIVSSVGACAFFVIGLILKNAITNLELKITSEIYRVDKLATTHDGICDNDRAEICRRLTRIEDKIRL